jgi:hypothetical protein
MEKYCWNKQYSFNDQKQPARANRQFIRESQVDEAQSYYTNYYCPPWAYMPSMVPFREQLCCIVSSGLLCFIRLSHVFQLTLCRRHFPFSYFNLIRQNIQAGLSAIQSFSKGAFFITLARKRAS